MRIQCLYGRQECMFVKKGKCPREGQCLLAGELKAKAKLKVEEEEAVQEAQSAGGGEDIQDGNRREVSC
jgi:hypothetical protein